MSDIVERLIPDGACVFCGNDPYHREHNGMGMERVAVNCCDYGVALYQDADDLLIAVVKTMADAAAEIERLREALACVDALRLLTYGTPDHIRVLVECQNAGRAALARKE